MEEDQAACIVIECSADGELSFSCDWIGAEDGITSMATILMALDNQSLSEKILENLKSLHKESQGEQDQVLKIDAFYRAIKKLADHRNQYEDEDVVVYPLDVSSLM